MARRIASQIVPQPAVRPLAPVPPSTGLADIGALIQSITRTGTAAAQAQGREFQQERQVGAIERQAQAAEDRFEIAQVDQERLELQVEQNRNRLLTVEAQDEIERLTRLEFSGFGALLAETPLDKRLALLQDHPFGDSKNHDSYARQIGRQMATADQTNLMGLLSESLSAQQEGLAVGPPRPLTHNTSEAVLAIIEERKKQGFDDPLALATYEQQLTSAAFVWRNNIEKIKQARQAQELASGAREVDNNSNFAMFDGLMAGEEPPPNFVQTMREKWLDVNVVNPNITQTIYLDNFAISLSDWADSIEDKQKALAVVKQLMRLGGEQFSRPDRLGILKTSLESKVQLAKERELSEFVRGTRSSMLAQIEAAGVGGTRDIGKLESIREKITALERALKMPTGMVETILAGVDGAIAAVGRTVFEETLADRVYAGLETAPGVRFSDATLNRKTAELSDKGVPRDEQLTTFLERFGVLPEKLLDGISRDFSIKSGYANLADGVRSMRRIAQFDSTFADNLIASFQDDSDFVQYVMEITEGLEGERFEEMIDLMSSNAARNYAEGQIDPLVAGVTVGGIHAPRLRDIMNLPVGANVEALHRKFLHRFRFRLTEVMDGNEQLSAPGAVLGGAIITTAVQKAFVDIERSNLSLNVPNVGRIVVSAKAYGLGSMATPSADSIQAFEAQLRNLPGIGAGAIPQIGRTVEVDGTRLFPIVKDDPTANGVSEIVTHFAFWEPATQTLRALAPGSGPTFDRAMDRLRQSTNVFDLHPDAHLRRREGDPSTVLERDSSLGPGEEDQRIGPQIIARVVRRHQILTGGTFNVDDPDDVAELRSLAEEEAKLFGFAGFQPGP